MESTGEALAGANVLLVQIGARQLPRVQPVAATGRDGRWTWKSAPADECVLLFTQTGSFHNYRPLAAEQDDLGDVVLHDTSPP